MKTDVRRRLRPHGLLIRPLTVGVPAAGSTVAGLLVAGLLAGGCTAGAFGAGRPVHPKVKADHTVAPAAAAPLTGSAPQPGVLRTAWTVELPPGGPATSTIVAGQVLVTSGRGLDAYDAATGRQRWRYYEPGRQFGGFWGTGGAIVLWSESESSRSRTVPHLAGLDAGTGRLLWTSRTSWEPDSVDRLFLSADGFPAGGGVVAMFRSRDDPSDKDWEVIGVDARTGRIRWTAAERAGCDWQHSRSGDSDGSLLVFVEQCLNRTQRVRALVPETGRERWTRELPTDPDSVEATTHGGATALEYRKELTLLAADGRELRRQACDGFCLELLGASGGRLFLQAPRKGRGFDLLTLDPRTGKQTRRFNKEANGSLGTAAGGVYYGLHDPLAEGLLPAGLHISDPDTGSVRRMPLPVGLNSGFIARPAAGVDIDVAGGRVFFTRATAADRRTLFALVVEPAEDGPVELGGVPEGEWPDACELAARYRPESGRREQGVTIGQVTLDNVRCRYEIGDLRPTVTVAWVAADAEQAKALLAVDRTTPRGARATAVQAGDEAYYFDDGPFVMRVGRYIVTIDRFEGTDGRHAAEATALARAISETLRKR
jgi:hypothetical protein